MSKEAPTHQLTSLAPPRVAPVRLKLLALGVVRVLIRQAPGFVPFEHR